MSSKAAARIEIAFPVTYKQKIGPFCAHSLRGRGLRLAFFGEKEISFFSYCLNPFKSLARGKSHFHYCVNFLRLESNGIHHFVPVNFKPGNIAVGQNCIQFIRAKHRARFPAIMIKNFSYRLG